jgi:hypothetical protein
MKPTLLLLSLVILSLATSCGQRQPINVGAIQILDAPIDIADQFVGRWDANKNVIYLSWKSNASTLMHELCHAADTYGSFEAAYHAVGTINSPHYSLRLQQFRQTVKDCNGDHWLALKRIYGSACVEHKEFTARLSGVN